jgi:hypothetical protein
MGEYRGFRVPEDLYYDLSYHVWLQAEDWRTDATNDCTHRTNEVTGRPGCPL